MSLISMMYASKTKKDHDHIKSDLMSILTESIHNNTRSNITGVLYYGNGYFLQYIEGNKEQIEALFYQRILKDPRHSNCEIIYYAEIETAYFKRWSMKFAPINHKIKTFFKENHIDDFNPYLLTSDSIQPFIKVLKDEPSFDVNSY